MNLPHKLNPRREFRRCGSGINCITLAYTDGGSEVRRLLSMHLNFNALPNLIALAILVGVFAAIARQHTNERVHFWLVGWALVLLRSVVQFAHVGILIGPASICPLLLIV